MKLCGDVVTALCAARVRPVDMAWLLEVPQSTIRRTAKRVGVAIPKPRARTPGRQEMAVLLMRYGQDYDGLAKHLGIRRKWLLEHLDRTGLRERGAA